MFTQTKASSCIRAASLILIVCVLQSQAISASRLRTVTEKSRFESRHHDRYERTPQESRSLVSELIYGGGYNPTAPSANELRAPYQPRPEPVATTATTPEQPESGSLVSGLLVTRLASDMARLSHHALRSKETKIPVYVAVAEAEDGIPSTKSIPRLIHLMDASSAPKQREPSILPATLGSDEEVEEQLLEFFEKFRQYQQMKNSEDKPQPQPQPQPTKSSPLIPIGGYGPPTASHMEEEQNKSTEISANKNTAAAVAAAMAGLVNQPNIFQTPTLPEIGRGPTNQVVTPEADTQSVIARLPSAPVEPMEKAQSAAIERRQEEMFRQHIESMVRDQFHELVKQQIALLALNFRHLEQQHYGQ